MTSVPGASPPSASEHPSPGECTPRAKARCFASRPPITDSRNVFPRLNSSLLASRTALPQPGIAFHAPRRAIPDAGYLLHLERATHAALGECNPRVSARAPLVPEHDPRDPDFIP